MHSQPGTVDHMPVQRPLRFLRPYQADTVLDLARGITLRPGATFTVLFPRQAGKNEVAASLVGSLLSKNFTSGGSVIVCAPTFSPQAEISINRARKAMETLQRILPAERAPRISGATITVGEATATFLSASREANVAGHTASLALIADEAQDIEAEWFDRQFRPMAASTAAPTVLFGTPWNGESLLDLAVAANRLADARERRWPPLHMEVPWAEVALCIPVYGDYIRAERDRLGANHPLFLTQYELVPVTEAGRLFSGEDLELLEGAHPRLRLPAPGERYVAGLDIAGEGEGADTSVLTIGRVAGSGCEVVEHLSWRGVTFGELEDGVVSAARRWGLGRLAVDATGMGAPFAARLRERLGEGVDPVTFSVRTKSEMGFALLAAARSGRLTLYASDQSGEARACRLELRHCSGRLLPAGKMRWGAAPGAHDDYVASLALCLRAAGDIPGPRLARGRSR